MNPPASRPSFFAELQRRNVHRAAVFYAGAAWLLVQIATQVFPFFHIGEWVVRWIVIAAVIGFPFAMLFSWFYEWTPQGILRTSEIDHSESITQKTGKRLDKAIIAVLGLAVVVLLVNRFVLHRFMPASVPDSGDKSIAVLPLANSTGDAANEYFSDGVSEELISSLSRLSHLKVIGRTSSFQFKGKSDDSRAIGEKLGVAYLLEGSVRKSSDRVRIAVALVKSADGANVWSETYDRELKDIFAVQSEIAGAVADKLKIALLGNNAETVRQASTAAPSNQNIEAFNALLQGRFYSDRFTEEDAQKAIGYFEQATRLDPGYALAFAALSGAAAARVAYYPIRQDSEKKRLTDEARSAADTALRLDPGLGAAHHSRASVFWLLDQNIAGAELEARRAAELAPQDSRAVDLLGWLTANLGRFEAALVLTQRAIALDPLNHLARYTLAYELIPLDRYGEAEAAIRKAIELQPQAGQAYAMLSTIQILQGHPAAAVESAKQETDPLLQTQALALAYFANGEHGQADAALQKLIGEGGDWSSAQIAAVYALRNEPDKMFEWLERGWSVRDGGVLSHLLDPFLLRYRDDPRYLAFAKKIGVVPATAPNQ